MSELLDASSVSHVIQLAVAPVFLLTGIGSMLGVMSNRLSRVIDRARLLEARLEGATPEQAEALHAKLSQLSQRARLIGRAITFCTMTSLLVCTVIIVLFSSATLHFNAAVPVAVLFIAAMGALFCGLLWFLREIFLATASLRIGTGS